MRRILLAAASLVAALAIPSPVAAHGLVGRLESPLPLVVYVAGAAIAVALSFLIVALRDVRIAPPPAQRPRRVPMWLIVTLRALGLVAWIWIVAQAIVGGSSAADVSELFLWIYGWVGLAIVSAFAGPIWSWLDPFATIFDIGAWLVRRLKLPTWARAPYPEALAEWPAVIGLVFFIWLELVAQNVPLAWVLVAYTGLTLVAMAQFGRDPWRERGEVFSVWFATLGRLAPFAPVGAWGSDRVRRRPIGSGLLEGRWSVPLVCLVALGTASIIFDGLSQTRPWFDLVGFPSLPAASLHLLGFLGLIVAVVLAVARIVGLAAMGAGLLPIAVGYLVAHYFTYLLGDGQRIVIAISDPLQLGWDLFGTAFYEPGVDWIPPSVVWTIQLAAVIGGHVAGAWYGHAVARKTSKHGEISRQQVPLAIVMVFLTSLTLWSLGQAIVAEPGEEPAARRDTPAMAAALPGGRSDAD